MLKRREVSRFLTRTVAAIGVISGVGAGAGTLSVVTAAPAAACNLEPTIGSICTYAFDWCPRGYLPADGRTLQVNTNQAIFSLIGFRYGGDNANNFNLPDLRGRVAVGKGQGPNLAPVNFAEQLGQQQVTLNAAQVPVPAHNHPAAFTGTGGGTQKITVAANPGTLGVDAKLEAIQTQGQANIAADAWLGQGATSGVGQATIYVPSGATGSKVELGGLDVKLTGAAGNGPISFDVPTGITGGAVTVGSNAPITASQPVSTQPPSLGLTVCIAINGLYPDRP